MRTVKELKDLIPILLKGGYYPDEEGNWSSHSVHFTMTAHMLTQCGQTPSNAMAYHASWLEEIINYPCIMQMIKGTELVYFTEKSVGVLIDTGTENSKWDMGELGGWDMTHFKPYAIVTLIGALNAKENN